MITKNYTRTIITPVSVQEAFAKIARVSEWWGADFSGRAQMLGDRFTIRFGETFVDFEIIEAEPDRRIVWEVTDCHLHWLNDKTEWKGTKVEWDLSSSAGMTSVVMTHHGLVPGIECYETCEPGWDGYLKISLPRFFATGVGLPDGAQVVEA